MKKFKLPLIMIVLSFTSISLLADTEPTFTGGKIQLDAKHWLCGDITLKAKPKEGTAAVILESYRLYQLKDGQEESVIQVGKDTLGAAPKSYAYDWGGDSGLRGAPTYKIYCYQQQAKGLPVIADCKDVVEITNKYHNYPCWGINAITTEYGPLNMSRNATAVGSK